MVAGTVVVREREAEAPAFALVFAAPVSDPDLPLLTESARGLGFFFCGLGPAFADGADTFLLQLLSEPLDTGKLQIFTDVTNNSSLSLILIELQ